MITRRQLLTALLPVAASADTVVVPVRQIIDPASPPRHLQYFLMEIWSQAVRDFRRCGVQLDCVETSGNVRQSPSGRPVFAQLERGVINLVLTDRVPLEWDEGRGLEGVTTLYEGKHVCLIALGRAHCHQIPFLSVNTCVHEILHVLMHDVFERKPGGVRGHSREFRIDYYATRLWLMHEGADIRNATRAYLDRIRRQS